MHIVLDIEANSLNKPTQIWCIVCKDIDTGERYIFRNVTSDEREKSRFIKLCSKVEKFIGHNILGYDCPVLFSLLGISIAPEQTVDTLIISKLVDYSRKGHSIEAYGEEFGLEKIKFNDWTKWSLEQETYCARDVDICHRIYNLHSRVINDPDWSAAILLEHRFQVLVNSLHDNGFCFNSSVATVLLDRVTAELVSLDEAILKEFPPKEVLVREFTPKATKFGTISKTSVPRFLWDRIHEYEVGQTYKHTRFDAFNPASHKQVIQILNEAGWSPIDKTQTHIDTERELNRSKYSKSNTTELDLVSLRGKMVLLEKTGWKINETNLNTLPDTAPTPARTLARRILYESRRRTLTEWLNLVEDDGRIHGKFYGIGAWTHRMAHQQPNTANIPAEFNTVDGSVKLLGKEMRTLWQAPKKRLLVGVDAEGIQLRIFAHYIDDKEFTQALVEGKKDDKTDPHSLNQRVLGSVCKSRQAAKRFVYALLLGGGVSKLSQILGATKAETEQALDNLIQRYTGFAFIKTKIIPTDARRGYFTGLDGRRVSIPGDTDSERKHLAMSGYLQNGEAIVMKKAAVHWHNDAEMLYLKKHAPWLFVNMVHDEWQTEITNNMEIATKVAKIQADSLKIVGEELGLKCPLAGSYYNDDHKEFTIGTNWYKTH